ncbi:MAG TPA: helix-turn-helix transcriptional regulator [Syntrophomonadaceae bacterium]|nr:helix-turn-helix transcriptional regulator [Syntrophomonadaceae bacterium]HPR94406.1 helix-turn-helix transcriptional regulator [Syntrophomonadaceae bacterium]
MNKLNIGKCIVQKRKEKGITQEKLAEYIGVSKASVSKWESGQSYPDILLLPELATYFNVTVDELLGYSPQLTSEDIKKVYNKLSHAFVSQPFEEVMEKCNQTIKEYYSCFPLLLAMIQLLLNYSALAKTEETKIEMLQQCIALSRRVKEESDNIHDIKSANSMEALAEMGLGNSTEVIRLLNDQLDPYSGDDVMLIMAYQMLGENAQANKVNQILLYQNVIRTLTLLNNYLTLHMTEPELFEQIYAQGVQLLDSFQMQDILTNAVFGIHIVAAQGYLLQQNKEKALKALEQYVNIVCGFKYPLKLKGNAYFDQVDEWVEDSITIGSNSPIDEAAIKANFIRIVEDSPVFMPLREDEQYIKLVKRLKEKLR